MRIIEKTVIAFLLAGVFSFQKSQAFCDLLPDPDENVAPCKNKKEGESCSTKLSDRDPKGKCVWQELGGSTSDYVLSRLQYRSTCEEDPKSKKNRCLKCDESHDGSKSSNP